jgi:hypothetical protein
MIDKSFIDEISARGNEAKAKATREFSKLTLEQLNWKPTGKGWSIGQCLDHLIQSHRAYYADLEQIVAGTYEMTLWEKYSPLTKLWGRELRKHLQETVKKKMVAPKLIQPAGSNFMLEHLGDYYQSLDDFLSYISKCKDVDIDHTIINSPTVKIVTYSLRDAFQFLLQHEHRHLNQAIRVKVSAGFPA